MSYTNNLESINSKPKIAVHKFSSCDGCQLAFINDALSLIELTKMVEIVHFAEAGPVAEDIPVDIAFIEGSINTEHDIIRIKKIRQNTKYLVSIGACACSGGIQALRNYTHNFTEWVDEVYPLYPEEIKEKELVTAKSIASYVAIDNEIRGCPVSPAQIYGAIRQLLFGVVPQPNRDSVCITCKKQGITCVLIAKNEPCLGPVTADGCNALCPSVGRACYGCYGESKATNTKALTLQFIDMGFTKKQIKHKFHFINNQDSNFKAAGEVLDEN